MGPRKDRCREEKISFNIKTIIVLLTVIIPPSSVFIWLTHFKHLNLSSFVSVIQIGYIMTIGVFIIITLFNRIIETIFKTLFKLIFNVGIISFIMISTLSPMKQNLNIIFITIIIGYLEAYLEIYNLLKNELINFSVFKYLDNKTFYKYAKPISIIIVAIIHGVIPFAIDSFIKDISFN